MMLASLGSPLDYTTSQDTSIWASQGHVSGLHAGQKRKVLSNFIQDNMRAKTLSMVKKSVELRESRNVKRYRELIFRTVQ